MCVSFLWEGRCKRVVVKTDEYSIGQKEVDVSTNKYKKDFAKRVRAATQINYRKEGGVLSYGMCVVRCGECPRNVGGRMPMD